MTEAHMAGRPRKNGQRYPSGDLVIEPTKPDLGTPEVVARRMALVGPGTALRPADPNRAYYPLGVMLERAIVDDDQHAAGLRYHKAFTVAIGRPLRLGDPAPHAGISDDLRRRLTIDWRAYSEALVALSRSTKDTVDNVILYERWPRWLTPGYVWADSDVRERDRFLRGIDAVKEIKPTPPDE